MNYEELAIEWLKEHKYFIKEATYANYCFIVHRHLLPIIGDKDLSEFTNSLIQQIAIDKSVSGRLDGNGSLSNKSVKDVILVLRLSLDYGIKKRYITHIIDFKIHYPYNDEQSNKIKIFTNDEMSKLVEYLKKDLSCKNIGLLLTIHTGIRIGEICALKWKCINTTEGYIKIERTIQRLYTIDGEEKSKVVETSPKSKKSERIIPTPKWLNRILKLVESSDECYVLTSTKEFIEPRSYRYYFKNVLTRNKINILSFHSIRHTFATTCIKNKIDYKTTSEILGHASVATTLDLYAHSDLDSKMKCINKLKF